MVSNRRKVENHGFLNFVVVVVVVVVDLFCARDSNDTARYIPAIYGLFTLYTLGE